MKLPATEQPRNDAYQILSGALCGFGGILLIYAAEYLFGNDLKGELMALIGITLIAAGVLLMLRGYLRLILARLSGFFHDHKH